MPVPKVQTITELLAKEIPKAPMYIEPAVLPKGGTLVLGAEAKTGKSFVLSTLQRSLATGKPLFGLHQLAVPFTARTLYVENEIGEYGLQKRAHLVYGGMTARETDNLLYIPKETAHNMKLDSSLTSEHGYRAWEEVVKTYAPEVLIIDPIAAFHTTDENDAVEFEKLLGRIDRLKAINPERRMAVIMAHHSGKPNKDGDPLNPYSMRGTSKMFDRPDTILMLHRGKNLATEHLSWELKARFRFRHGEDFDDMLLHVNEHEDGQVKFVTFKTATGALPKIKIVKTPAEAGNVATMGGRQLTFESN